MWINKIEYALLGSKNNLNPDYVEQSRHKKHQLY
jgi:hypothetical protein